MEAPNENKEAEKVLKGDPSNAEFREMLVDIQINVASILRENKTMSTEIASLKSTIQQQKVNISSLKTFFDRITKQNAERELAATRKILHKQEDEIYELYDLQARLEQYTRKNSLEIHGVPESAYLKTWSSNKQKPWMY